MDGSKKDYQRHKQDWSVEIKGVGWWGNHPPSTCRHSTTVRGIISPSVVTPMKRKREEKTNPMPAKTRSRKAPSALA
jgi:hypothetical protein